MPWAGRLSQQPICSFHPMADSGGLIELYAEHIFWLHWMNIFATKSRRHQDVVIAAARSRNLKNPWPAGLQTPHPPSPPARLFFLLYLLCRFQKSNVCSKQLCVLVVKPVTAAAHPFPPCFKIELCSLITVHRYFVSERFKTGHQRTRFRGSIPAGDLPRYKAE